MKKKGIVKDILLFILFVVMLILMLDDLKYIFTGKADDINEIIAFGESPEIRKTVSIKVQFVIGWYTAYVPWMRDEESDETIYYCCAVLDNGKIISIGAENNSDEYEEICRIISQTQDYLSGETDELPTPVTMTGVIRKIDSEICEQYKKKLRLMGYDYLTDAYMLNIDMTQRWIYHFISFMILLILSICFGIYIVGECFIHKKKDQERMLPVIPEYDRLFNQAFDEPQILEGKVKKKRKNVL